MSHEDLPEGCYEINRNNLLCRLPCIKVAKSNVGMIFL